MSAPRFQIVAPLDTLYDLDGDKLVDVRLTWSDAGRVDPASARVRTLRPLNGTADTTTNLLDAWRATQRDSAGLWVHETLANLLPDDANALEVSVADTAGNRFTDTLRFTQLVTPDRRSYPIVCEPVRLTGKSKRTW